MFQDITRTVRRFLADTRAGATAYSAVAIALMTVGGAALIVDHNQLVGQRDLLQSAADAASMSATLELGGLPRSMPDSEVEDRLLSVARKYAVLNVLGNANDPDLRAENVGLTLDIDRAAGTVGATVRADIAQNLMSQRLFGQSGPGAIARKGAASSVNNPVEVVLAIDISQSMERALDGGYARRAMPEFDIAGAPSRMEIVKQAALELVDIVDPNRENRVAVGVVPWHTLVRLDETARASWVGNRWAEYPTSRNYAAAYTCRPEGNCTAADVDHALPAAPGEEWLGCLDEHRIPTGGHAVLPPVADLLDHPSDTGFAQAIYPTLQGTAYECLRPPLPDNFHYQVCYGEDTADLGRVYGETEPQNGCTSPDTGDPIPSIQPLTSDRASIETAVDSLKPVGDRTYSTLGVLWGQRLLSHSWNDVWGGAVHPVDPDAIGNADTRKAIVLLTDGEDNPCGLQDPTCATNDVGIERSVACTAAKAAGTEIFVIAAMHPDNVTGKLGTSLRACSSEADRPEGSYVFLENRDPETLRAAFSEIARQLRTARRIF